MKNVKKKIYRQKGYNILWPWEIEVWKLGDPVPEWLGDRARVKWIDGEGNLTLDLDYTSSGGYNIKAAGIGQDDIVKVKSKSWFVYISSSTLPPSCFQPCPHTPSPNPSHRPLYTISPELLEILYEEEK